MKVKMEGWWHPVKATFSVVLSKLSDAERLVEMLREMGSREEADELERHIQDQQQFRCGSRAFYINPSIPAPTQDVAVVGDGLEVI